MNYVQRLILENKLLAGISSELDAFTDILEKTARARKTIFACGNGGSAADADHISTELLKSFLVKRHLSDENRGKFKKIYGEQGLKLAEKLEEGIKSIPLGSFQAFLSAYGNDVEWNMAYAQLIYAVGTEEDLLIGISCSGNAENISNAFKIAKIKGIFRILLTGANNGICVKDSDLAIMVPEKNTYRIQEFHSMIYHAVCAEVEKRIFQENPK